MLIELKRVVSRLLGQKAPDNTGERSEKRIGSYYEDYVIPLAPDMYAFADEGSYFTANNGQTGIATPAAPTAFAATTPFLILYNKENPANSIAQQIIIDYIMLLATAAGTAGTSVQFALVLDSGNRYVSGGTVLTPNIVNSNGYIGKSSNAVLYGGAITASAPTGSARTIVGNRFMKGAIPVAGDQYTVKFGGVDAPTFLGSATITSSLNNVPKIIIPPNWSLLLYVWLPAQSAASSYAPELGWIER